MTSAAQEEFNELVRDKATDSRHPEDRDDHSDHSDKEPEQEHFHEQLDTDDELDLPADMRSTNYILPSIRSEANTGPKGVIADAHAFEKAKKQARRFTWKRSPETTYTVAAYHDEKASSDEDGEDNFMRQWREARLRELQNVGQRIRSRTTSPSRRIYGSMPTVDGEGYLEAIERVARDTAVVVFIYDDSTTSKDVERIMHQVARGNDTTRFVKLHHSIAEIDAVGVPAVLAYKNGELFASLTPLLEEMADDSELSAVSIETVFRRHRILN